MLNFISDIIFKNRYGAVQTVLIKTNLATDITFFTIDTFLDARYSGVLTLERDWLITRWYCDGQFTLEDHLTVEDYRYEKYAKTDKKWGWRDIIRFRRFLK